MGDDRQQAIQDWLQLEGYSYLFRQRRWRVWRLNRRAGEWYEDNFGDNEYVPGQRTNVSIWYVTDKEFREPGQERKLRKVPGDKKRSSEDTGRNKKWKEFLESQAFQARALVPVSEHTTPQRPPSPSTPSEDAMGDVLMGTPEAYPAPAASSSSAPAASSSSAPATSSSSMASALTNRSTRTIPDVKECRKRAKECKRCTGRPCLPKERQRRHMEQLEQRERWTDKRMTERQKGVEAWRHGWRRSSRKECLNEPRP